MFVFFWKILELCFFLGFNSVLDFIGVLVFFLRFFVGGFFWLVL